MTNNANDFIEELSAWAESDEPVTIEGRTLTGKDAANAGRQALAKAGRPTLGEENAIGHGRSPRRQVRLDRQTNERLDSYAKHHGKTASQVIREALEEFLTSV